METTEQLLEMIGKTVAEEKMFSPLTNEILEFWQFDAMIQARSAVTPRVADRIKKASFVVVETWTWKRQPSRFETRGWTLVKDNQLILRKDTGEPI